MIRRKKILIFTTIVLFLFIGCGNRIDNLLNQFEKKIIELEDFCKKDAAGELTSYDHLDKGDIVSNLYDDKKMIGAELTRNADYMNKKQVSKLIMLMERLKRLE